MNKVALDFGLIVVSPESLPITIYSYMRSEFCRILKHFAFLKTLKALSSKGLVPRAGIEPARPILSYPRILSPAVQHANNLDSFSYSEFKSTSGPHSGLTRISIYDHLSPSYIILNQDIQNTSRFGFGGGYIGKTIY